MGSKLMNEEEILKNKEEGVDKEREHNNQLGDDAGFWGLIFLSLLIMIYQALMKLPFGDIPALLFCFVSIGSFARYKTNKDRSHLIRGILTAIACIACLAWYILDTIL